MNYSDGTNATFSQSLSDWHTPQSYDGESIAASMSYRDVYDGTKHTGAYNLCLYTIALDRTKPVTSIALPTNSRVEILGLDLIG